MDCAVRRSEQGGLARFESVSQRAPEGKDVCRIGGETLTGLTRPRCDLSNRLEATYFEVFCGLCIVKRVD